jgi:hypothetical protein
MLFGFTCFYTANGHNLTFFRPVAVSLCRRVGYILAENRMRWVKCALNNVKSSLNPQRGIARGRDLCHNATMIILD